MSPRRGKTAREHEREIVEAVLYAMRHGVFHPVPMPMPPYQTNELIRWGALRHIQCRCGVYEGVPMMIARERAEEIVNRAAIMSLWIQKIDIVEAALLAARREEREACAKIVEDAECDQTEYRCLALGNIAAAIRARVKEG